MDCLKKYEERPATMVQNRLFNDIGTIVPRRADKLSSAEIELYELVAERATVQPMADLSIYSIVPDE